MAEHSIALVMLDAHTRVIAELEAMARVMQEVAISNAQDPVNSRWSLEVWQKPHWPMQDHPGKACMLPAHRRADTSETKSKRPPSMSTPALLPSKPCSTSSS